MHQRNSAVALTAALLCAAPVLAATIYKWTDADGVVHFSDQPTPGAERIITQSSPGTSRAAAAPSKSAAYATTARRSAGKTEPNDTAVDYNVFEIDSPQPEQTFHDQIVNVRVRMEPALKPGHLISLYLNGKLVEGQSPKSTSFTLTDLARGAYSLSASVMDAASGETKASAPINFYVQQPSLLSPLRKKK